MKTTTFTAPEIECQGCASAITKSVGAVTGVTEVLVDIDAKSVTVHHDDTASLSAIVTAVEKAGFSVSSG